MRLRLGLLFVACILSILAYSQAAAAQVSAPPCLGKFASHDEAEDFLRTAKIVKSKALSVGVTGPQKLTLEKDGRQEFGIFKSIDEHKKGITQLPTGPELDFKDSWKFEIGAYEIDKLLGLNMVPPTVERMNRETKGSLQLWIEGGISEGERAKKRLEPADRTNWGAQIMTMRAFDNLIYNIDRNSGNILITADWKLVLIDHSRSFKSVGDLKAADALTFFSKSLMQAFSRLDEKSILDRAGRYLDATEIRTLLQRRDKILALYRRVADEPAAVYP